jgi:hypothetical protein
MVEYIRKKFLMKHIETWQEKLGKELEKKKLKGYLMNKNRMKIMSDMINSYNTSYFSIDWIIKMLGLERNEVRKYKINKLFENEE